MNLNAFQPQKWWLVFLQTNVSNGNSAIGRNFYPMVNALLRVRNFAKQSESRVSFGLHVRMPVVVLTSSQHYSLNPKYRLSALSGHPRPFEKYRLETVELQSRSHWGINLPYESSAGYGEIRGWQQK